ncbi:uncharacterized protein LOC110986377 [Acanthaster planci]|uniref:Uncharacterized protein LOC110986377 n=1 Tax=Acanthaster planci TaxID=133434 RepID=A0A8B7ZFW9_ACAPL|nr:uncharacterized protein LOC110986377 [Acanthaster planci]
MSFHMAHPSVRMKGSEADWAPVQCTDSECTQSTRGPHLHCPFCPQESLFTDQVLLKAHYRVKHVDKGIDFGGLKILRCCRPCIVHGIIHEQKCFKGAHWHCYHCRNGFSRRDEATKHYQQHFRHPETTIQIVITRDVNQIFTTYSNTEPTSTSLVTHLIVPQSNQAVEADTSADPEQTDGQQVQYQYTCVDDSDQSTTDREVVLIEIPADGNKGDLEAGPCCTEHDLSLLLQEKEQLEKTLQEERAKWAEKEHRMKGTIDRLRAKVEYLSNTNTSLKQQLSMMHTSSLKRLTHNDDHQSILEELVQHMSEEHNQLLHHHLAQLRLFAEACNLSKVGREEPSASKPDSVLVSGLADQSQNISQMTIMPSSEDALGTMEQTVVMTITAEENSEALTSVVGSQENSVEPDTLSFDKDVQMSPNDIPYQLTGKGLSPKSSTSESGHLYQSNVAHSPHRGSCGMTQPHFPKDKSLKLMLSEGSPKIFCADSFDKRTFEDDISNEGPPLKRQMTSALKAS